MTDLTVILITYNHANVIEECVVSLNLQSVPFNLIVVDDASTDNTVEIITTQFQGPLRLIENEKNRGIGKLSVNYNDALKEVDTKYVAIIEGDDVWHKDKLKEQLNFHILFNLDFSCTTGYYLTDNKIELMNTGKTDWSIMKSEDLILRFLFKRNSFNVPSSSFLFSTDALRRINGFYQPEGWKWVDKPTVFKLLVNRAKFGRLDIPLTYWRRHDSSFTIKNHQDLLSSSFYAYRMSMFDDANTYLADFSNFCLICDGLTELRRQPSIINFSRFFISLIRSPLSTIRYIRLQYNN